MSGCHINRVPGRRAACVLAVLIWQCRPCGFAETGAALDKRVRGRFVSARPRQPRLQTLVGRAASAGEEVEGLLLEEKLGAGSFGTTWKESVAHASSSFGETSVLWWDLSSPMPTLTMFIQAVRGFGACLRGFDFQGSASA